MFSPLDQQATRENWVCLLNAKQELQVARGESRLCVNTKPNYLPIVHLKDGESCARAVAGDGEKVIDVRGTCRQSSRAG